MQPGPPTAQDAVLRLEGVTKTYVVGEVEVHALRGVDFELLRGELLVLLGPSGSDKSTLLNILGGLDVPTQGRVLHGSADLSAAGRGSLTEFRRAHVGFVFQFYNLIPSLTALENVRLVTDIAEAGMDPAEAATMDAPDRRPAGIDDLAQERSPEKRRHGGRGAAGRR